MSAILKYFIIFLFFAIGAGLARTLGQEITKYRHNRINSTPIILYSIFIAIVSVLVVVYGSKAMYLCFFVGFGIELLTFTFVRKGRY